MSRLQMALDIVARRRGPLTPADPLQRPTLLAYPELETSAVWDSARFEWGAPLEAACPRIRAELERLLR